MSFNSNKLSAVAAIGLFSMVVAATPAMASSTIVYQDLPTSLATPPNISFHNAFGPIIADDFVPVSSTRVSQLTWWGSISQSNMWEVVLQNNNPALGQPAITPPGNNTTGGLKQFVAASMVATTIPGIYRFDAQVGPGWNIKAGTNYWLTVANAADGWNWALALGGPTIGSENFNAHSSVGPGCGDGGPHCGPWTDLHTDFSFQVGGVPEPASWAMLIVGFGAVGLASRRRQIAVAA